MFGTLELVRAKAQIAVAAERAAAHAPLDNPAALARLLERLRWVGAEEQAAVLAERAAAHAPLDNPAALGPLRRQVVLAERRVVRAAAAPAKCQAWQP
jgi:hypothetical protein